VDHYNRYEEDIDLLSEAGLNAYRFSIEWARIEPDKGNFKEEEILHYKKVLEYCISKGVTPIVTMHHFSSPKWLIEDGGWESEKTIDAFADYCSYVVKNLGDLLSYVCTINEANMGLQLAAIIRDMMMQKNKDIQVGVNLENPGEHKEMPQDISKVFAGVPPLVLNSFLSMRTQNGDQLIMRAHEKARDAMKVICPHLQIGITLSLFDYQVQEGGEAFFEKEWEAEFTHYLPYLAKDDFFGLQNYTRKLLGPEGALPVPEGAERTQMDFEFYPQSVGNVIRKVANYISLPIIVTENGLATTDDTRRVEFIKEATAGVMKCVEDGIPVKGYCYWSLLDNFEWQKGFGMTFGLIAVDRANNQKRYPKESLYELGKIAEK
jgi:beta-glucosidase